MHEGMLLGAEVPITDPSDHSEEKDFVERLQELVLYQVPSKDYKRLNSHGKKETNSTKR